MKIHIKKSILTFTFAHANSSCRTFSMDNIKAIELGFENCESEVIPIDLISNFYFKNIHKNWEYSSYLEDNPRFEESTACSGFLMVADYNALNKISTMQDCNLGDRIIRYQDLVDVTLFWRSGKKKQIYVPWEDDDSYSTVNSLMNTRIDKDYWFFEPKYKGKPALIIDVKEK